MRRSLQALATQVGLALESATLSATIVRSETEARFSALVQNSSDVIFVLEPDTWKHQQISKFNPDGVIFPGLAGVGLRNGMPS